LVGSERAVMEGIGFIKDESSKLLQLPERLSTVDWDEATG
jgi:hypothetical protein